jgi:hypothetical protein
MLLRRSAELFFLLLLSCSPYRDFQELGEEPFDGTGLERPFEKEDEVVVYKTRAELYGRGFSGLLYIKRTGERSYRTAFSSEMGMSFFDLRFEKDAFEVRHCLEKFDRKAVISRLRMDMRLLLMCTIEADDTGILLEGEGEERVWRMPKGEDGVFYYHIRDREIEKGEVVRGWRRKRKVVMHLSALQGAVPTRVRFEHHDVELILHMERVR